MLHIIENNGHRRTIVATVTTFAEGLNKLNAMEPLFLEEDSHYRYCADAYMRDGRVLALQPIGFDINDQSLWTAEKQRADAIRDSHLI